MTNTLSFEEYLASHLNRPENAAIAQVVKKRANDDAKLRLQPKQQEAERLANQVDALLYGGAAGGGKTHWLLVHMAKQMLDFPGNRGVIFRRVFPSLNRSIIGRAEAMYRDWATYNKVEHKFYFHNGSVLELASLQYANSVNDFQGTEYGVVAFEEVTEFLEPQVDYFKSRLRAPVDGPHPHMIATTNPGGIGHRWVKRMFVKPLAEDIALDSPTPAPFIVWKTQPKEGEPPTLRAFVPATLDDNPALAAKDPGYRARLRSIKNAKLRKALESGDWDAIEKVDGALWALDQIDYRRIATYDLTAMASVVVGVDPSGGSEKRNDQQGIVAIGKTFDGQGQVMEDRSCRLAPAGWGQRAVMLALDVQAEVIAVEKNFGGDMATDVIRNAMKALDVHERAIKIVPVTASRGKRVRAEPIAQLYGDPEEPESWDGAELVHAGHFPELEEQMTNWIPESGESPDHMDGMVWAATKLFGVQPRRGGVLV